MPGHAAICVDGHQQWHLLIRLDAAAGVIADTAAITQSSAVAIALWPVE